MCEGKVSKFKEERDRLNDIVLKHGGKPLKRFFNVDAEAYKPGCISTKTKELLGLVASLVLRCDDCIRYHLIRCAEESVSNDEMAEVINIALVAGGSITIPHIRRAFEFWEELVSSDQ